MKSILFALFVVFGLSGCGGSDATTGTAAAATGACASSVLKGSWAGTISGQSERLTFNADCSGIDTYCAAAFSYANATAASGSFAATVTATNGLPGCFHVGTGTCTYAASGSTLTFSCSGSTVVTYTKQ